MIYVDPLCQNGWIIRGRLTMNCHMFSDVSADELHTFAQAIGLHRRWFQQKPGKLEHYDLTPGKRAAAVADGAQELTREEMGAYLRLTRKEGQYANPINKVTLREDHLLRRDHLRCLGVHPAG